jgi:hypothetical protein
VEGYILKNERLYWPNARPLSVRELGRFFPAESTDRVRVSPAEPALKPPRVQQIARWFGYGNVLEPEATAAITFRNVIVFVQPIDLRTLFHEMVHAEQYQQMGIRQFARKYVTGFLRTGMYEQVPMERHAYQLDERYAVNPALPFSVKDEVRRWIEEGRY